MTEATVPNLFEYATSELSQDAFICWLLAWADQSASQHDPGLHELGVAFVAALARKGSYELPSPPYRVEVQPQVEHCDVVAVIGDSHVLAIEDKVHTGAHSGQLEKYSKALRAKYPKHTLVQIFFKTGEQSSYAKIIEQGWKVFDRRDLLGVLRSAPDKLDNAILNDFWAYLERLESAFDAFKHQPLDTWNDREWAGFFRALQAELEFPAGWKRVPNQSGGFMAFFWGGWSIDGGTLYLQLEEGKLAVRVRVEDPDRYRQVRNLWSKKVLQGGIEPAFTRPERFGHGRTMSIAELDQYWRTGEDGCVDLPSTRLRLEGITEKLARLVEAEGAEVPA